ncbi:TAXI family TRAP transporter solute-binding subunit [Paractinoplanes bogorensis]|uniref:TAXI family TRAP transporter solute-binding subunit n=1 Tax=Paractinoplanes bogorensis TaxID=1610840 RepID=UPI0027DF449A|nr:TAXI family TRAP transporter solute-binding subunit [Actinoplanes bogorensis]
MSSSRRALLFGALGALATGACVDDEPSYRSIRIATGSPTAVYYAVGTAYAKVIDQYLPNSHASVVVTAASAENVERVRSGNAQIGFSQADILAAADGPPDDVAALARVYDDLLHLVVRVDSSISKLEHLRGKRVSIGGKGSGTAVTVQRLLSAAKMAGPGVITRRELNLDDSMAALRNRAIDGFFFSGGLPVAGIEKLSQNLPIRIVGLADWAYELRRVYSDVYVVRDVPTSAYKVTASSTVAVPNLLVVSTSMPDSLAFDLTRLLLDRRDLLAAAHPAAERLDLRSAISTLPVPLHPGAARYYQSVKP